MGFVKKQFVICCNFVFLFSFVWGPIELLVWGPWKRKFTDVIVLFLR